VLEMDYKLSLFLLEEMQNIRKEEWVIGLNTSLAPNMKKADRNKFAKSITPYKKEVEYSPENMKKFLSGLNLM